MSWKKFGKTTTEEGHKVFSSKKKKKEDKPSMASNFLFTRTS